MKAIRFEPIIKDEADALKAHYSASSKKIKSLELVYLPFCLFKYKISRKAWLGEDKSDESLLLADMVNGIPINVPAQVEFNDKTGKMAPLISGIDKSKATRLAGRGLKVKVSKISVENADLPEKSTLKTAISHREAVRKGLWALRYDLMNIWGPFRSKSLEMSRSEAEPLQVYFPYWILYYPKNGKMDFEALDALSGSKEGTQIKMSIVRAMSLME
ncbi:MAG: hypothetical protein PHH26_00955 [Candidatus Thermoplasmatota archaeon]|nr:hypothetical protein [Candidatus Thermoplasmatota archaeon]